MSLQDELARMKAELAQGQVKEQEELEEAPIEQEEEEEIKEPEKEESVEEKKEEPKEEPKEEEKLDNAGYARLRREAAAEKRLREQKERELEEVYAKLNAKQETPQEEVQLPPQVQSIVERDRINQAAREFDILESQVKHRYPEYSAVASEYAQAMYQSIRLQNPRKSQVELSEMTRNAILMQAGEFARQGFENPVEELFHTAKELGYTGKSFQKEEPKEERLEPDMRKVAENRKRSTGMTANNGRSEGQMTIGVAADLTSAEWARLPKAERQRLMYGR